MYIDAAIPHLVESLDQVSNLDTKIFVAHGRNRQAETTSTFMQMIEGIFTLVKVAGTELDARYQCIDVDVYLLQKCK
jgi:hypothetical protein